jgi:hypothetical protein
MGLGAEGLRARLDRPVDGASLALFRVAFGLVMAVLALRFFTHGWVAADYLVPRVFFPYWGFGWVRPWPGVGMYLHYGLMGLSALAIAAGVAYRPACVVFFLTFTYAHLCDKANYLNHYYLLSLVSALLVFLPLDREASLRVWRRPSDRRPRVRSWVLFLLRFQIGLVYVFGGLGKVGVDWLVHAEPLRIWLAASAEFPLLGRLFGRPSVALAFSWAGMIFDLSIVPLLLWRRSRPFAYLVALGFHGITAMLFKIGMFPWVMSLGATLFFDPSWPRALLAHARRLLGRPDGASPAPEVAGGVAAGGELAAGGVAGASVTSFGVGVLGAYALVQVLMPFRFLAYPGNTLWTEEGFRFSWKVMLIEKSGALELTVVDARGRRTEVDPRQYLTPFQARMTATQPDMILHLAHVVARDFDARGVGPVAVYADARVSFNGRASAPLIDPRVDLARCADTLAPRPWILPAPTTAPGFF